eukprot:GILK01011000.1.p1 GENE.GILK01011000.1~~GILK01011000.1.p1  ORF type:complete len:853 (-),score=123.92 GILK01011000.1:90-2621(-)
MAAHSNSIRPASWLATQDDDDEKWGWDWSDVDSSARRPLQRSASSQLTPTQDGAYFSSVFTKSDSNLRNSTDMSSVAVNDRVSSIQSRMEQLEARKYDLSQNINGLQASSLSPGVTRFDFRRTPRESAAAAAAPSKRLSDMSEISAGPRTEGEDSFWSSPNQSKHGSFINAPPTDTNTNRRPTDVAVSRSSVSPPVRSSPQDGTRRTNPAPMDAPAFFARLLSDSTSDDIMDDVVITSYDDFMTASKRPTASLPPKRTAPLNENPLTSSSSFVTLPASSATNVHIPASRVTNTSGTSTSHSQPALDAESIEESIKRDLLLLKQEAAARQMEKERRAKAALIILLYYRRYKRTRLLQRHRPLVRTFDSAAAMALLCAVVAGWKVRRLLQTKRCRTLIREIRDIEQLVEKEVDRFNTEGTDGPIVNGKTYLERLHIQLSFKRKEFIEHFHRISSTPNYLCRQPVLPVAVTVGSHKRASPKRSLSTPSLHSSSAQQRVQSANEQVLRLPLHVPAQVVWSHPDAPTPPADRTPPPALPARRGRIESVEEQVNTIETNLSMDSSNSSQPAAPARPFLKRKSVAMPINKVDWSTVGSRVDCWVKKNSSRDSHESSIEEDPNITNSTDSRRPTTASSVRSHPLRRSATATRTSTISASGMPVSTSTSTTASTRRLSTDRRSMSTKSLSQAKQEPNTATGKPRNKQPSLSAGVPVVSPPNRFTISATSASTQSQKQNSSTPPLVSVDLAVAAAERTDLSNPNPNRFNVAQLEKVFRELHQSSVAAVLEASDGYRILQDPSRFSTSTQLPQLNSESRFVRNLSDNDYQVLFDQLTKQYQRLCNAGGMSSDTP